MHCKVYTGTSASPRVSPRAARSSAAPEHLSSDSHSDEVGLIVLIFCKKTLQNMDGPERLRLQIQYEIAVIVLPQVLSTTRLVLITSCIDQNLATIRFAVANYLRLLTHCSLNNLIIS